MTTLQRLTFLALTFMQWLRTGRAAGQMKGTIITSLLNSSEQLLVGYKQRTENTSTSNIVLR